MPTLTSHPGRSPQEKTRSRVPAQLAWRRVYHFTHIDNLPSVATLGLLSRNHDAFPVEMHRSVADSGLQRRRAAVAVPCGPGGSVHDYVPLYFGARSPMLHSIISGQGMSQADLVYLEFPISLAERPDVVFTRASAHTIGPDGFFDDAASLERLHWLDIDSQEPESPIDEQRHRRMAELLVHRQLPLAAALACVAFDTDAAQRVEAIIAPYSVPVTLQSLDRIHWY